MNASVDTSIFTIAVTCSPMENVYKGIQGVISSWYFEDLSADTLQRVEKPWIFFKKKKMHSSSKSIHIPY